MAKVLIRGGYRAFRNVASLLPCKDDYELVFADNDKETLRTVLSEKPDVILLDIEMPELDGFEVCRQLKGEKRTAEIPVILMAERLKDGDAFTDCLVSGADDYICKPLSAPELLVRIQGMFRLKNQRDQLAKKNFELARLNDVLECKNHELVAMQKTLREIAITDSLTLLYNRRYFVDRLEKEFLRTLRHQQPIGLVMLDIDHFKEVNDTYGHQCGDQVLFQFSEILRQSIRKHDIVARYGGEEFIIGLSGQRTHESYKTGERIRTKVEKFPFRIEGLELKITCSAGIASYPEVCGDTPNFNAILQQVDAALYQAKRQGRNQVICAGAKRFRLGF